MVKVKVDGCHRTCRSDSRYVHDSHLKDTFFIHFLNKGDAYMFVAFVCINKMLPLEHLIPVKSQQ